MIDMRKQRGSRINWIKQHAEYNSDECLMWPFALCNGYGFFYEQGRRDYAHRYMCELVNGRSPSPDYEAAHSCGKGHIGCVNPRHLSWKTKTENQLDRAKHGTKNVWARRGKLTPEEAAEIRELRGQFTQQEIADMFGTSRANVSLIHCGNAWVNEPKGFTKRGDKYTARIKVCGEDIFVSGFESEEAARLAYKGMLRAAKAALR